MDSGSTLHLPKNEQRVSWVLDRLRHDKSRKASTLAILQAVPLYYAAVAVKQSGTTMSSTNRDALLADRYKSFIAPAFLRFLREEYNFQAPTWVTTDLMGQTTFTDNERRYYDPTRDAIWDRYQQAERDIRKTVTPWINKWITESGSGETPPTRAQCDSLMHGLHEHLWKESKPGAAKKMDRAEFQRRVEKGERLEVARDDDDGAPSQVIDVSGNGSTQDGTDKPATQEGGGAEGAGNPTDGASPASEVSCQEGDPGDRPGNPDHEGTMMTVRAVMPENWVHRFSLVICFFAKISHQPDADPSPSSANGHPNKRARISAAGSPSGREGCVGDDEDEAGTHCAETAGGRLSRRSLNLLSKGDEPASRRDVREQKAQDAKDLRMERCLESFADRLSSSPDQSNQALAESVQGMATAVRDAESLRRERLDIDRRLAYVEERSKKIEWLKLEIHTLEDMGWSADAQKAKMRLVTLLRQPLPCDVPPAPVGAVSANGGSSLGHDGARSGAVDGNGATPSG